MVSLLIPLVLATAAGESPNAITEPDPPVQVWLNSNAEFDRGDYARVYVRTQQDGYLVVLHADADGRVRILFPLDPGQDEFVRGGQNLEIRGRGDRETFLVDERSGTGVVLAAWSPDPFQFNDVTRTDHWDYRAIAPNGVGDDAETGLLDLADHLAAGQRYYYDVAEYIVGRPASRSNSAVYVSVGGGYCFSCWSFGWSTWEPGFRFGITFGVPYRYRPIVYDPWYSWGYGWYDPYWYRPIYRPVRVWNPYPQYWGWPPYRRSGFGVHVRYANGCWGSAYCNRWNPPRGRPGRATGVGFDQGDWRHAFGLTEPRRETAGLGLGRVARQVSDVRGTEPRRFADGLATSPDRMRSAVQSNGGQAETRGTGGIARSADTQARSAQARAGQTETGQFENRRAAGLPAAVRNDNGNGAAAGRSTAIRSSVEPDRGIARARDQVRQPANESGGSSTGIRATDGGRPAISRPGGSERAAGDRTRIMEFPARNDRGSASSERGAEPAQNRSNSGIRSSVPRPSSGSATSDNVRSSSTAIIRSGPPRASIESRSQGIRSSGNSNAVPRSNEAVRSSAPQTRSGGSASIRSRVTEPSRSAPATRSNASPPRSGSSSRSESIRSSSSGQNSSIRGSVSRPSSGSARPSSGSGVSRSSSPGPRSQPSASRGSASGSSSRGVASAARRKN